MTSRLRRWDRACHQNNTSDTRYVTDMSPEEIFLRVLDSGYSRADARDAVQDTLGYRPSSSITSLSDDD